MFIDGDMFLDKKSLEYNQDIKTMENKTYKVFVDETEYSIKYLSSGFSDPQNRIFYCYFSIQTATNKEEKKIVIGFTDESIDKWKAGFGKELVDDDLLNFCLQVIPQLLNLYLSNDNNIKIIFHRDENVSKIPGINYSKIYNTPAETAKMFLFSSTTPTNSLIRRKILEICYSKWQEEPHGFVNKTEFLKFIPVDEVAIERNLKYLVDGNYLNGSLTSGGYILVAITKYGIDIFENPDTFNKLFSIKVEQQTVNVGGDYVSSIVVGNDNTVVVNSELKNSFNELQKELDKTELENKKEVSGLFNQLKDELLSKEVKPNKVKEIMSKISKTSDWLNKKIFSHPIIA